MKHRYFKREEFDCSETGENQMEERFIALLDTVRHECGFPFQINSGFRSIKHSKEIVKEKGGMHTKGIACDVRVRDGRERFLVAATAIEHGFTGIGVAKTFVHVDLRETTPVMWTY